jgi:4-hydroxy-tetrahydrodipicolinate synthase
MHITGVVSVLPTPFRAGGDVDLPSLSRLADAAVAAGVQALSLLGSTGEASRMTERERLTVVDTVTSRVAGRLPVCVDTSSDGVRTCLEFSRQVKTLGAAAAVISPPRAQRLSVESVVNHYRAVAEALDLPIVVQDAPSQCGVSMDAGLLVRIAREVPAARTLRLEDPPTSVKIARIRAAAGETRVDVLGGQGGLFLIEDLLAGAAGVASAFAYPEVLTQVVTLFRADRVDEATDVFHRFVPLLRFENQEGIGGAVRKEMWRRRGVFADGSTRAPGFVLDEGTRAAVDQLMVRVAAREGAAWILG